MPAQLGAGLPGINPSCIPQALLSQGWWGQTGSLGLAYWIMRGVGFSFNKSSLYDEPIDSQCSSVGRLQRVILTARMLHTPSEVRAILSFLLLRCEDAMEVCPWEMGWAGGYHSLPMRGVRRELSLRAYCCTPVWVGRGFTPSSEASGTQHCRSLASKLPRPLCHLDLFIQAEGALIYWPTLENGR